MIRSFLKVGPPVQPEEGSRRLKGGVTQQNQTKKKTGLFISETIADEKKDLFKCNISSDMNRKMTRFVKRLIILPFVIGHWLVEPTAL